MTILEELIKYIQKNKGFYLAVVAEDLRKSLNDEPTDFDNRVYEVFGLIYQTAFNNTRGKGFGNDENAKKEFAYDRLELICLMADDPWGADLIKAQHIEEARTTRKKGISTRIYGDYLLDR